MLFGHQHCKYIEKRLDGFDPDEWIDDILDSLIEATEESTNLSNEVMGEVFGKYVKAGKTILVSNFYGNVNAVLRQFGLDGCFSEVIESAVVGVRKPDPEIWRRA